jgi:hypothetical protein
VNKSTGELEDLEAYLRNKYTDTDLVVENDKCRNTRATTYSGFGATYKTCSHGRVPVVRIGEVSFHGGTTTSPTNGMGLVVALAKWLPPVPFVVHTPPGWEELLESVPAPVPVIECNWNDYGVPNVGRAWWEQLLAECSKRKIEHVMVCCTGGHGRTGTALAALCVAGAGLSAKEAIKLVRDRLCKSAIETLAQEQYVERL